MAELGFCSVVSVSLVRLLCVSHSRVVKDCGEQGGSASFALLGSVELCVGLWNGHISEWKISSYPGHRLLFCEVLVKVFFSSKITCVFSKENLKTHKADFFFF